MSGIAGIWHPEQREVDALALRRMTAALTHRGPDGAGFHHEPGLGLGHCRLEVGEPDSDLQPVSTADGRVHLVMDGRVFNHPELRADLLQRGHRFRTNAEAETLLHLYAELGPDFVARINGPFAIILWDRDRRRLLLARDRVGMRPLFHAALADGSLLIASEMKGLFAHGDLSAKLDPVAVGQIISLWAAVPPRTSFVGVREVPPGSMLVFEDGREHFRRYWCHEFPAAAEHERRPFSWWEQHLQELLEDAVMLRSRDPVAAYLSGGLDSSILATLAGRQQSRQLRSFSLGFADVDYDERAFQRHMIGHLQTEHREIEVDDVAISAAFSEALWLAESPMIRTAPAAMLLLAGLAKQNGVKAVLSGEGADEIFGGYNIFREDKARRFWARSPDSLCRPMLLSALYGYVQRDARAEAAWRQFFRGDLRNVDDPFYSHRIRWRNASPLLRLLAPDFRVAVQDEQAMLEELDAWLGSERMRWHPLSRAQQLEMTLFMSGYLLSSQGDRMMMGRSVEGRMPFLDHRVIEFAARVPPQLKIRGMKEKYILKRSFEHMLPADIAQRPKHPYRAPVAACFLPGKEALAARLLEPAVLEEYGVVNPRAVAALLRKAGASGGAGLGERDQMGLALAASLQLLQHHFVVSPPRSSIQVTEVAGVARAE